MKKILFTVSAFPPETEIGCIRVGNIAKELKKRGFEITVLSVAPLNTTHLDHDLNLQDYCNSLDTINNSKLFSFLFYKRREKILKGSSALTLMSNSNDSLFSKFKNRINIYIQYGYTLIRNIDLYLQFKKKLKLNYSECTYDYVFSSYPSLCSIWAGSYAKKLFKTKLIVDFRDPILHGLAAFWLKTKLNKIFENKAISTASLVTSVSEGILSKYLKDFGYKMHVLYNGYSTYNEMPKEKKAMDKFRISYVGALYGGKRDLSSFFDLIRQLTLEHPELKGLLEICYAGREGALFNNLAEKFFIQDITVDLGLLNKQQALNLQYSSDMLLVITWNTKEDQGVLTGKLFESFGLKVPVFGIIQGDLPNSEFSKIVNEVEGGLLLEEALLDNKSQVIGLKTKLRKLIIRKSDKENKDFYNSKIVNYSTEKVVINLVNRMLKI